VTCVKHLAKTKDIIIEKREPAIEMKGKGLVETYWIKGANECNKMTNKLAMEAINQNAISHVEIAIQHRPTYSDVLME
jgi:hypothetical protein